MLPRRTFDFLVFIELKMTLEWHKMSIILINFNNTKKSYQALSLDAWIHVLTNTYIVYVLLCIINVIKFPNLILFLN